MRGYDAWLTTDRAADEREAVEESLDALWSKWVDMSVEDGGGFDVVPYEAVEDDHPAHFVYVAWRALAEATDRYIGQLEAQAQAAEYEQEIEAQRMEGNPYDGTDCSDPGFYSD